MIILPLYLHEQFLFTYLHSSQPTIICSNIVMLVTRAVLLMFLLELEISGVAVQSIHQNSEKWQLL